MTAWMQVYKKWDSFEELDPSLRLELDRLKDDYVKLEDSFYKGLEFGTGEMCGLIGPGTNRMNIYTVRKAANGLANYLLANRVNVKDRGVVIAYGLGLMSKEFALEAAKVLAFYGIRTYLFESVCATPLLSYAVRYFGTTAGIMITASDYSKEYNGFAVYNENGAQMTLEESERFISYMGLMEDELTVPHLEQKELLEKGLIYWVKDEIDQAYIERLRYISKMDHEEQLKDKDLKIVFTPLHGTALPLVKKGLEQLHFGQVHVVEEQAIPDTKVSSVISLGLEENETLQMAIELGQKVDAEILLATNPNGNKLRVAVKTTEGNYQVLTGNQLGSLLLDYILGHSDPNVYRNSRMIKSVITTELGRAIADSYYVKTIDTLPSFNYIGEKIATFDSSGETFLFGFEESDSYLVSGFVRDKDAIQASVVTAEMTYYWKKQGKTLLDVLDDLYQKHGYYLEGTSALTLEGKNGLSEIQEIMNQFKENPPMKIAGLNVRQVENYEKRERKFVEDGVVENILLPKENMIKFHLENNAWVGIRPSSIEHKIKYYFGVCEESAENSKKQLSSLQSALNKMVEESLKNQRINFVS
ncbi:phospho-sugar mutase [Oceanobacillus sp. Castelsardo]|uniref:phospho-sugar mutase n=1 Tax=Oceanobacillus sp. Castelsardo TaxID=1851204 RepID=UPI00083991FA|nr:phospho-sugar mutase [Oceanobacillus sp. Castelsardo]